MGNEFKTAVEAFQAALMKAELGGHFKVFCFNENNSNSVWTADSVVWTFCMGDVTTEYIERLSRGPIGRVFSIKVEGSI